MNLVVCSMRRNVKAYLSKKFLKQVPTKPGRQLAITLASLKENPLLQDAKKLKGTSAYHRVDLGEYRVTYRIGTKGKIVIIAFIGKRNDNEVYKKFKRKNNQNAIYCVFQRKH